MKVRLISVTKPVAEEIKDFTTEELTAYVARVSNPSNQMNNETAAKLLGYCIKNQHWSVFEHAYATFEIVTSRAIAAQILRHRSFTFAELSQRYSEVQENEIYPARRQDDKNRQNSIDDMSDEVQGMFKVMQETNWHDSMERYHLALGMGIAKEQARMLLPLSAQTKLYMTGNIRSWVHYVDLRTKKSAQLEHREIAEEIKVILKKEFPAISEAKEW